MTYSREGFQMWLRSLPQDEPFCRDGNCPINQWLNIGFGGVRGLDPDLVFAIDNFASGTVLWDEITPAEVLQIISEVEAQ